MWQWGSRAITPLLRVTIRQTWVLMKFKLPFMKIISKSLAYYYSNLFPALCLNNPLRSPLSIKRGVDLYFLVSKYPSLVLWAQCLRLGSSFFLTQNRDMDFCKSFLCWFPIFFICKLTALPRYLLLS